MKTCSMISEEKNSFIYACTIYIVYTMKYEQLQKVQIKYHSHFTMDFKKNIIYNVGQKGSKRMQ